MVVHLVRGFKRGASERCEISQQERAVLAVAVPERTPIQQERRDTE
jgi:hypothetical protein